MSEKTVRWTHAVMIWSVPPIVVCNTGACFVVFGCFCADGSIECFRYQKMWNWLNCQCWERFFEPLELDIEFACYWILLYPWEASSYFFVGLVQGLNSNIDSKRNLNQSKVHKKCWNFFKPFSRMSVSLLRKTL